MALQYISDGAGHKTAVVIPIEDWNEIREKHPDVEVFEGELPKWQKDLLDHRLRVIEEQPERVRPLQELLDELNRD